MDNDVTIQVGTKNYHITPAHLPPVGTRVMVHKHLTGDGNASTLEIVGHEWRLEEPHPESDVPVLSVWLKTKAVK